MNSRRLTAFTETVQLPRPATPAPAPGAFMLCCVPCANAAVMMWQQELYRRAQAEAEAVVRPSLPERDLAAAWN